jgi:IS5 family transposase
MLVLQQLINISDEELEFQVNDRRSFEKFVGLGVMNNIPDATTVAFFRERLRKAGVNEELFEMFETYLRSQGLHARGGQIIDATLVPVPKQRNTREENKKIKAGRLPEGWDENQDRLRQKDLDARWTKKNGISYYGYKNSICIDVDHGFIRRYAVKPANIHDSAGVPRSGVIPPAPHAGLANLGGASQVTGSGWCCKRWAGPFPWFEYHLNQTNHAQDPLCRT